MSAAADFPPDRTRCERAAAWFATLRNRLCAAFEALEDEFAADAGAPAVAAGKSR